MGLIASLFGTEKIAQAAVDAVVKTGDALLYTDEEKTATATQRLEWVLKYMEATNPQNVARRVIALIVVALWAVLVLLTIACKIGGLDECAEFIFSAMTDIVATPFTIIITFYFATHLLRGFGEKKKPA